MKVADIMTTDVRLIAPNQTLREAAMMMFDEDIGVIPVADKDRLVGMVTDRDIAIRGVAQGKGPDAKVRDIMTEQVKYCFADERAGARLPEHGVRADGRLPVMNRDKRLVGIVSLGDLATTNRSRARAEQALHGISQPGD